MNKLNDMSWYPNYNLLLKWIWDIKKWLERKKYVAVTLCTQWKYLRRRFHDKLVQILHFHFILPSHSSATSTSPLHHQPSCSFRLLWNVINFIAWTHSKLLCLDYWQKDIVDRPPQVSWCWMSFSLLTFFFAELSSASQSSERDVPLYQSCNFL